MRTKIKENTQISSDLGTIPLGASSPDMSKDYVAPNFGVKDISTAKPKYKKYKSLSKKIKEDIFSFDGVTDVKSDKPFQIERINEFKEGILNVEFSKSDGLYVRLNGGEKQKAVTYFSELNVNNHSLRYLLLHTIGQYVTKKEFPFNLNSEEILFDKDFQKEIMENYAIDLDPADFVLRLKQNESKIKTRVEGTKRSLIFKYTMSVIRSNHDPMDRLVADRNGKEDLEGTNYGKFGKDIYRNIIPKDQRIYTVPPEEKLKRRSYE